MSSKFRSSDSTGRANTIRFTNASDSDLVQKGGFRTLRLRKTKIVATVGPTCETPEQIRKMIAGGVSVFRLNFSHGDHQWHSRVYATIREQSRLAGQSVAIMQDLCGPKIRVSHLREKELQTEVGQVLTITTAERVENGTTHSAGIDYDVATSYATLLDDLTVGDPILINDGRIELKVTETHPDYLRAEVLCGGPILMGKGFNLPGSSLSTPSVTKKDWEDLRWGVEHDIDFVALSFVRHWDDLREVHTYLDEVGSEAALISKIERPEALTHINEIVKWSDAIMVARGDLALETDFAEVPLIQKQLISLCRQNSIPVITATQMLDSMVNAPSPTRAEVSDVANAIYDGSDAIMLSNETAAGQFPHQAVEVLHQTALANEDGVIKGTVDWDAIESTDTSNLGAITEAAAVLAMRKSAQRVVIFSNSSEATRKLARFHLPMPIVSVTNSEKTYNQLALSYGVQPVLMTDSFNLEKLLENIVSHVIHEGWAKFGDKLVILCMRSPLGDAADSLHIHEIRE